VEGNWNRPPTNFGLKVALYITHIHMGLQHLPTILYVSIGTRV